MKRLKKTTALLLSLALLLSGVNLGRMEVQAAGSNNTTGKLVIKLSGTETNKARILSGKKILPKRRSVWQREVRFLFPWQRTKK